MSAVPGGHVAERRAPLRIAAVGLRGIPSGYSGLERSAESLYAVLAERGHRITVYCRSDHAERGEGLHPGIRLVRTPYLRRRATETLSHAAASLAHALLGGGHDLVHLHALAPGLLARACRFAGVSTVATVQGLDWRRAKWKGAASAVLRRAERGMVANVDEMMVVSRDLQRYYREEYGRESWFVPNGVGIPAPGPPRAAVLEELGLRPGRFVAFVGRLVPEKRVEDLIRAFRAVETDHRLAIVGEGGYTDAYVAELRALARADPRVVLTGHQGGAALDAVFRGAALYVQPSELEGMPMSLLEAMSYALPAVVSDIPPHRELLGGVMGEERWFRPGDVAGLARSLRHALSRPEEGVAAGRRARDRAATHHSWTAIATQVEEVLHRAASGTLSMHRDPERTRPRRLRTG